MDLKRQSQWGSDPQEEHREQGRRWVLRYVAQKSIIRPMVAAAAPAAALSIGEPE
jgi:hypothetical protein